MFSVIIPLFKFADALVLPQWDAERVSKLGDSPKPFKFVLFLFDRKDGKQDFGGPLILKQTHLIFDLPTRTLFTGDHLSGDASPIFGDTRAARKAGGLNRRKSKDGDWNKG